eukprot:TRINITY_DN529_c0_g1_i9.p1 TRINITY_DN529_c0_g1~~TRINITY_DN529_c0_g1_i9.p1  ORF type:complete len:951 (+),score=274.06 TRINITY_DN529_c0_g1_i9:137-2854(+)
MLRSLVGSEMCIRDRFDSAGAQKEMHAVNQEFEMHKDQDLYRLYHVEKELANPHHPNHRFTIGNLDTLGNVTNAKLTAWYGSHYSSNLMHVAVYTAEPLDKVVELIVDKFSKVKNQNYQRQNVGAAPTMDPKLAGHVIHVKPLTAVRSVSLKWELPTEFASMTDTQPGRIVGTLLGDEGPNSLLAYLREEQLATGLQAGFETSGRDNALFAVSVSLSEEGMKKMNDVIAMVFRAIAKFGAEVVPEYFFQEAELRDSNRWKFQWRTSDVFNAAMGDAQAMIQEPIESYPCVQSIIQAEDPEAVQKMLQLLRPNQTHISVMGDDFSWANNSAVKTEKYYQVTYAVSKVSEEAMAKWDVEYKGANPDGPVFELPAQNDMIPRDLMVSEVNPDAPVFPALPEPVLVVNDTFGSLYVKTDDVFGDPYIEASFEIKTDAALMEGNLADQAKTKVMAELWATCITESLRTETYAFDSAGLRYGLGVGEGTNLFMSISGMNTAKPAWTTLLRKILNRITTEDISAHTSDKDFLTIYQAISRSLANGLKAGPSAQANRELWAILANTKIPLEEQIKALEQTTYEDVVGFGQKILRRVRVKGFFYGQIPVPRALEMWDSIKESLLDQDAVLSADEEFVPKFRVLPTDQGPFYTAVQGDARGNSTVLVVDGGVLDCADKIAVEILYQSVRQMFFNDLRTKQQTGYVAQTTAMEVARRTVAMFVVVSSWAGPGDLLGRYEIFIQKMLAGLDDGTTLSVDKFASIKRSLLSEFTKPIANIAGMASLMEKVTKEYDGDFLVFKKKQNIISEMTIDRVKASAVRMLGSENKRRLAVLYSPTGVDAGAVPTDYKAYNADIGEFEKRPEFKCQGCVHNCTATPVHNQTHLVFDMYDAFADDSLMSLESQDDLSEALLRDLLN